MAAKAAVCRRRVEERKRERERERECVSGDYEPETLDRPAAPISAGFRRLHMFARHLIFIDPYMIYVHGTPKKSCRVASALEGGRVVLVPAPDADCPGSSET